MKITREQIKKKVLKNYELYKLQYSRLKRILKAPIKTIPYFIMTYFAYKHPFKVKYKTFWGDIMHFYLPEGNAIYYYGFFEANLTNFLLNYIQKGDIVIDIGAHVGYYSMLCSSLVEETGKVYSFEPTPRTFNTLKENTSIKGNVVVNNNAVLDKETEIEFVDYGPKFSAFNSFKKRTSDEMKFLSEPERIKVKTISLDNYCESKNIVPNFIKIDAEGAEYLILQAMKDIIKNKKPIITIEVAGEDEWKDNCSQSISFLQNNGYIAYEMDLNGYLHIHSQKESYSYDNLLFAHPENMERLRSLIHDKN
jgi:FkbM family methyltransferase